MAKVYKDVVEQWSPGHDEYVNNPDLPFIGNDLFEGSAEDIKTRLDALQEIAPGPISFEMKDEYDYWEFRCYITRKETDIERESRLKKARKAREAKKAQRELKEARERAQWEKLSKKYGHS